MRAFAIILLGLSGCATSAAGLADSKVEMTLTGARPPKVVATCVADKLIGNNQLRDDGTNYWILRLNMYGFPVSRWDFKPDGNGGTVAELRASLSINTGDERVKACLINPAS